MTRRRSIKPHSPVLARQTFAVRFSAEHEFAGTQHAVALILTDLDFHAHLDLPDLSLPEVEVQETAGSERTLKLRYEFIGSLDPIARRLLAGRRLTWIQTLVLDTATGIGSLAFAAEAEPSRLYGNASIRLEAIDTAHTRRRIEGEMFVKFPLVGGTAERRIVPGLVRRLDIEADAVDDALASAD
jgi:hypothetical protein